MFEYIKNIYILYDGSPLYETAPKTAEPFR